MGVERPWAEHRLQRRRGHLGGRSQGVLRRNQAGPGLPTAGYAPSIFELHLDPEKGTFSVVDTITLKRADGTPVTGLPNPLTKATTETPLDGNGKPLATDAAALDTEALVRLPDGTFWIGEENAPSILHVAADGKVLTRFVPHGSDGDFARPAIP